MCQVLIRPVCVCGYCACTCLCVCKHDQSDPAALTDHTFYMVQNSLRVVRQLGKLWQKVLIKEFMDLLSPTVPPIMPLPLQLSVIVDLNAPDGAKKFREYKCCIQMYLQTLFLSGFHQAATFLNTKIVHNYASVTGCFPPPLLHSHILILQTHV